MTVPEVRRLLTRLVWTENQPPDFILYWSWWRRRHQARAQKCHYKRRLSNLRTVVLSVDQQDTHKQSRLIHRSSIRRSSMLNAPNEVLISVPKTETIFDHLQHTMRRSAFNYYSLRRSS